MSSQIPIAKAEDIIRKNEPDPAVARRIVEELNNLLADEGAPKPPAVKKQYVVVISDPEGRLPSCDFVAWVVQIPESESPSTTIDRITRSAYDFNVTKKGRLLPVKTIGEALESVPSKFLKEADVFVKTKVPVLVVKTDNVIPREGDARSMQHRQLDRRLSEIVAPENATV